MKRIEDEFSGLSKTEMYLISRAEYEGQRLITRDFAKKLFDDPRRVSNILDNLKRKKRLVQIQRGKYFVVPIKAPKQLWSPNEYLVAKWWMGDVPYYLGYFTMYNYWGFTEQIPQTVFVLNTKRSCTKMIGVVKYKAVKIDQRKYYGIKEVTIEGESVAISNLERTLVDFLYNPIGSFSSVKNVLKDNLKKMDVEKFIRYLIAFPVATVSKRAGYLLQELGCKAPALKKLRDSLRNNKTYVALNPFSSSRKGPLNKDWKVIING